MDKASFFIEGKALFGSFPTQNSVNELESQGVRYFINLTHEKESKIKSYTTNYTYINYPINDRSVPKNYTEYACFIIKITDIIKELVDDEKIYIHCKGGHGRSGVVVASILCYINNISPEEAIENTTYYHNKRLVMRDKWRKIGSPQTKQQKKFIYKFFSKIIFCKTYGHGRVAGFSTFTPHKITYNGITYPTAEAAIQAQKNVGDVSYVISQQTCTSGLQSINLGNKINCREDWDTVYKDIVYDVIKAKFDQYPELKNNILRTGLGPIIHHSKISNDNILGTILFKLRFLYYKENMI